MKVLKRIKAWISFDILSIMVRSEKRHSNYIHEWFSMTFSFCRLVGPTAGRQKLLPLPWNRQSPRFESEIESMTQWDHFESLTWMKAEDAFRTDPESDKARDDAHHWRRWRNTYLRFGRDILGFGVYVFRKPDTDTVR